MEIDINETKEGCFGKGFIIVCSKGMTKEELLEGLRICRERITQRQEVSQDEDEKKRLLFEIEQQKVKNAFDMYKMFCDAERRRLMLERVDDKTIVIKARTNPSIRLALQTWINTTVEMIHNVYGYSYEDIDEESLTVDGIPDNDWAGEGYVYLDAKAKRLFG